MSSGGQERHSLARLIFSVSLIFVSSILVVQLLIPGSTAQHALVETFHWVSHQNRVEGSLFLAAAYGVSVIFLVPGTPFNLAAGFLFGTWLGAPVALFGAMCGGVASFLLGRTLAREWAEKAAKQHNRFRAIDLAIQKNGFNIVFLMRLSPLLPFPLVSYIFGISQVNFSDYVLGSIAGLIPVAIMESMIGAEMKTLTAAVTASHSHGSTLIWITFELEVQASSSFLSPISPKTLSGQQCRKWKTHVSAQTKPKNRVQTFTTVDERQEKKGEKGERENGENGEKGERRKERDITKTKKKGEKGERENGENGEKGERRKERDITNT
eukprot:CAMPEP_0201539640 /NCGR_PEP_ID=MMETSP0161_2-20130828/70516_1 /ASSEMBLY_ACC=CAM_ASM_000251 /TAXON_ID=180227 /ORGANISM="Neoparamoeba aestuarina, Strain SoJaBio B1-5/56/2" /LENGTH=324 /DNA_ID=CAMNT_0047947051 /DNA_START=1 /DNA_END=977 /DNA_ORIENTATION=-